jgi:HPt (histidine-containing phosphotransfer) domain-containing protein
MPSQTNAHGPPSEKDLTPNVRRSTRLIQLFLDHVPGQIDALELAVESGDAVQTRAHAHKLKGSCLALMAEPMARAAETLQQRSEMGDLSQAPEIVEELALRFITVAASLRQQLGD